MGIRGRQLLRAKAHYAVMVARLRSATGPFETLAAATGAPNSVLLEANAGWIAPGDNAIVTDARGEDRRSRHLLDQSLSPEPRCDKRSDRDIISRASAPG